MGKETKEVKKSKDRRKKLGKKKKSNDKKLNEIKKCHVFSQKKNIKMGEEKLYKRWERL